MAFLRQCLQQLRLRDKDVDLLLPSAVMGSCPMVHELGCQRSSAKAGSLEGNEEYDLFSERALGVAPITPMSGIA